MVDHVGNRLKAWSDCDFKSSVLSSIEYKVQCKAVYSTHMVVISHSIAAFPIVQVRRC